MEIESAPGVGAAAAKVYPCDVCGATEAEEIMVARKYMTGPLHVCKNCGLIYVRQRRSTADIAKEWSKLYSGPYDQTSAAVAAQHAYIARMLDINYGLKGKRGVDIGAGNGELAKLLEYHGAVVWSIDPDATNCAFNPTAHVFMGTVEDFNGLDGQFDFAVMNFTLECCAEPRVVLRKTRELLKPGGVLAVCTGARIGVTFNRPLGHYLSKNAPDTHPLRFSTSSLTNILRVSGFATSKDGPAIYQDFGLLFIFGKKVDMPQVELRQDDWREVVQFFDLWETAFSGT